MGKDGPQIFLMDLVVVGLFESKSSDSSYFGKGIRSLGGAGMLFVETTFMYQNALFKYPSSKASAMRNTEGNVTPQASKEYYLSDMLRPEFEKHTVCSPSADSTLSM